MKKNIILFLLLVIICFNISEAREADKWNNLKGTHFIIYYKAAPQDFIKKVLEQAEDYYNKITDDFGFRRDNFWLWDNRAKIYIYDDAASYQLQTGQPQWSFGCARIKEKIIYTYAGAEDFFNTVLPHEMGHIIFREFTGFDNTAIPLWLDEGVASFEEKIKSGSADLIVKTALKRSLFIPLKELSGMNPQQLQDKHAVNLFYAQAISLVGYLVKEFGKDKFILFCQYLRDEKDLSRALRLSYSLAGIDDLEARWQGYLAKRELN